MKYFFCVSCLFVLSSCYRMPSEDEYSLVPTTNNPAITHEKPGSLLPGGMGY